MRGLEQYLRQEEGNAVLECTHACAFVARQPCCGVGGGEAGLAQWKAGAWLPLQIKGTMNNYSSLKTPLELRPVTPRPETEAAAGCCDGRSLLLSSW